MKKVSDIKWSYLYKKSGYQGKCDKFIKKLSCLKNNYKETSKKDLKNISIEYANFWTETIGIAGAFLRNNAILVDDENGIVRFLLYSDIVTNGMDLYLLYRGIKNLKQNDYILPKKYFSDKFINLFFQLNLFFKEKIEKEVQYGMAS